MSNPLLLVFYTIFLDADYKRKVTDPVINLMEKICDERNLNMLQLSGAILK